MVLEYWDSNEDQIPVPLQELIGNRSYDTGKDCSVPHKMYCFEPIF